MNILIVDDSAVVRRIHKNTLMEHDFNETDLFEAEDGAKALQLATEKEFDLFLVDWNMPKVNGLEFVKKIRSLDRYSDTPIIMVTSEAAKYMVVEAIGAGVTNYVVKPIQGNILWQKIAKYVDSASGGSK
jgi:two-component system chemotaxis response regulator CheY